jgi:abortive infection bacteriophage resistance protein
MAVQPYQKPYLNVGDQLARLKARGMGVTDDAKACAYLERIGYYRLSGYWYPFRISKLSNGVSHSIFYSSSIPRRLGRGA